MASAFACELATNRLAVFADGRRRPERDWMMIEDLRRSGDADRAGGRSDLRAAQLHVMSKLADRVVAAEGDVGSSQRLRHAFAIETRQRFRHFCIERGAVRGAAVVGREARIVD